MRGIHQFYLFGLIIWILASCGNRVEVCEKNEGYVAETTNVFFHEEPDIVPFITIAHRGASSYLPEHTLPAYERAAQWGADYIELDLHMTADGHLVAIHDATVDRTTNGVGFVKDFQLAELKKLNAAHHFPKRIQDEILTIPTLEEVFAHFGDSVNYYIETKQPEQYPGMVEKLWATLQQHDLLYKTDENGLDKVIIQSFNEEALLAFHELDPDLPLVQLYNGRDFTQLTATDLRAVRTYAIGIGIPYRGLSVSHLAMIHEADLLVHVYTINDKAVMERYIHLGVDGIFTDRVDVLIDLLQGQ